MSDWRACRRCGNEFHVIECSIDSNPLREDYCSPECRIEDESEDREVSK